MASSCHDILPSVPRLVSAWFLVSGGSDSGPGDCDDSEDEYGDGGRRSCQIEVMNWTVETERGLNNLLKSAPVPGFSRSGLDGSNGLS